MARSPIRRIVVGVDGSEGAGLALAWAIELAARLDAEVIAVHAHHAPAAVPRPSAAPYGPDTANWERLARQDFELRWCAPLEVAGVRHRTVFQTGPPGDVVLDVAEARLADLIVTGRRPRGPLVELLAGSVSQRVLHGARCPVMVVPPAAAA